MEGVAESIWNEQIVEKKVTFLHNWLLCRDLNFSIFTCTLISQLPYPLGTHAWIYTNQSVFQVPHVRLS